MLFQLHNWPVIILDIGCLGNCDFYIQNRLSLETTVFSSLALNGAGSTLHGSCSVYLVAIK